MASTTKRAWKLQEFVAHAGDVNCLALGHKSGRVMVTGGEDKKVNMWAVGKPNCVLSLSGHTSPVEAVRFGNAEEMVVAGSLSGALKIWDLEAAKIMRTLTGHKANIRSLDLHPFGDFVASGSKDTNIKLWDIRRKGCIFTYKGHTDTVNSLRFSPDGRWIASAGDDSRLKLWDLAAGKLLHDFQQHIAPVSTVEFHPNEFLLASGSADRTVKYWDLESFDLVGSTDTDSTGVRCIFFHPEASALYSGGQDSLRVYGWEPVRSFDALAMGWGRVADIAMAQNQLIGASFSQTNVSTYVVDIQRIQPLGGPPIDPTSQPASNTNSNSNSSHQRRSFSERPATQSSKQAPRSLPKEEPEEAPPAAAAGGGGGDDKDDDGSIDIKDPHDFKEVFQTRTRITRSPTRAMDPFPAPPDDAVSAPTAPTGQSARSTSPKPSHRPAASNNMASDTHRHSPPERKKASPPPQSSSRKKSRSPPSKKKDPFPTPPPPQPSTPAAKRLSPPPPKKRESSHRKPEAKPEPKETGALNPDDFLPRSAVPSLMSRGDGGGAAAMSETEALNSIAKGHNTMMTVMDGRLKNLQIVRALWTSGNTKTALDCAIGMNDCAIIVDILNVVITRPALWNLDMCSTLLPQMSNLIIAGKHEYYVTTAMSALRQVLTNFASVIKSNVSAPPSAGVDMAREDRYHKCKACYKYLVDIRSDIRSKISRKFFSPQQTPLVRELNLLMTQLD